MIRLLGPLVCLCLAAASGAWRAEARTQEKPSEVAEQILAQERKVLEAAGRESRDGRAEADDLESRLEPLRAAAAARLAAFKIADWKGDELVALALINLWAERFEPAAEAFEAYLAGGAKGEPALNARFGLARALVDTGRIDEAAKLLDQMGSGMSDPRRSMALIGLHRDLALAYREQNRNEPAMQQAEKAYRMLKRTELVAINDPQFAVSRERDQALLAALIVTSLGRLGRQAASEKFHREVVSQDFARQPSLQALYEMELASARLIGRPPPELAVKRWLDGAPVTFSELPGQVVLVDFWAMWCGPCTTAFPRLRALRERYAGRGLRVIGVTRLYGRSDQSADLSAAQEWESLRAFREKHQLDYPQAVAGQDDPTNDEQFGVFSLPTLVVIDRAGQVRAVRRGVGEYRRLDRLLARLLDENKQ